VALKLAERKKLQRPSFAQIAMDLKMSPSEVHAAVKRCQVAHLLSPPELGDRPNIPALEEFLLDGGNTAFQPNGENRRGEYRQVMLRHPSTSSFHRGTNCRQCGRIRRVRRRASLSNRSTKRFLSPLFVTSFSTSVWPWWTRSATAGSAKNKSRNENFDRGCETVSENPNLALLMDAARILKPMLDELVFVGGCTTALLITDEAAAAVRSTKDVDVSGGSHFGHRRPRDDRR
jgi:hypothetical protein